jgi:hypothetical protein
MIYGKYNLERYVKLKNPRWKKFSIFEENKNTRT